MIPLATSLKSAACSPTKTNIGFPPKNGTTKPIQQRQAYLNALNSKIPNDGPIDDESMNWAAALPALDAAGAGLDFAAGFGDTAQYAAQRYLNWEEENPWKGAALRVGGFTGLGYLGIDQDSISPPELPTDPVEIDEALLDAAKEAASQALEADESAETGESSAAPHAANAPPYSGGNQNAPPATCSSP